MFSNVLLPLAGMIGRAAVNVAIDGVAYAANTISREAGYAYRRVYRNYINTPKKYERTAEQLELEQRLYNRVAAFYKEKGIPNRYDNIDVLSFSVADFPNENTISNFVNIHEQLQSFSKNVQMLVLSEENLQIVKAICNRVHDADKGIFYSKEELDTVVKANDLIQKKNNGQELSLSENHIILKAFKIKAGHKNYAAAIEQLHTPGQKNIFTALKQLPENKANIETITDIENTWNKLNSLTPLSVNALEELVESLDKLEAYLGLLISDFGLDSETTFANTLLWYQNGVTSEHKKQVRLFINEISKVIKNKREDIAQAMLEKLSLLPKDADIKNQSYNDNAVIYTLQALTQFGLKKDYVEKFKQHAPISSGLNQKTVNEFNQFITAYGTEDQKNQYAQLAAFTLSSANPVINEDSFIMVPAPSVDTHVSSLEDSFVFTPEFSNSDATEESLSASKMFFDSMVFVEAQPEKSLDDALIISSSDEEEDKSADKEPANNLMMSFFDVNNEERTFIAYDNMDPGIDLKANMDLQDSMLKSFAYVPAAAELQSILEYVKNKFETEEDQFSFIEIAKYFLENNYTVEQACLNAAASIASTKLTQAIANTATEYFSEKDNQDLFINNALKASAQAKVDLDKVYLDTAREIVSTSSSCLKDENKKRKFEFITYKLALNFNSTHGKFEDRVIMAAIQINGSQSIKKISHAMDFLHKEIGGSAEADVISCFMDNVCLDYNCKKSVEKACEEAEITVYEFTINQYLKNKTLDIANQNPQAQAKVIELATQRIIDSKLGTGNWGRILENVKKELRANQIINAEFNSYTTPDLHCGLFKPIRAFRKNTLTVMKNALTKKLEEGNIGLAFMEIQNQLNHVKVNDTSLFSQDSLYKHLKNMEAHLSKQYPLAAFIHEQFNSYLNGWRRSYDPETVRSFEREIMQALDEAKDQSTHQKRKCVKTAIAKLRSKVIFKANGAMDTALSAIETELNKKRAPKELSNVVFDNSVLLKSSM